MKRTLRTFTIVVLALVFTVSTSAMGATGGQMREGAHTPVSYGGAPSAETSNDHLAHQAMGHASIHHTDTEDGMPKSDLHHGDNPVPLSHCLDTEASEHCIEHVDQSCQKHCLGMALLVNTSNLPIYPHNALIGDKLSMPPQWHNSSVHRPPIV